MTGQATDVPAIVAAITTGGALAALLLSLVLGPRVYATIGRFNRWRARR